MTIREIQSILFQAERHLKNDELDQHDECVEHIEFYLQKLKDQSNARRDELMLIDSIVESDY